MPAAAARAPAAERRGEATVAERAEQRRPKHAGNSGAGREEGGEEARERAEEGGDRRGSVEAGRVVGVIPQPPPSSFEPLPSEYDEPRLPSTVPSSCRLELWWARWGGRDGRGRRGPEDIEDDDGKLGCARRPPDGPRERYERRALRRPRHFAALRCDRGAWAPSGPPATCCLSTTPAAPPPRPRHACRLPRHHHSRRALCRARRPSARRCHRDRGAWAPSGPPATCCLSTTPAAPPPRPRHACRLPRHHHSRRALCRARRPSARRCHRDRGARAPSRPPATGRLSTTPAACPGPTTPRHATRRARGPARRPSARRYRRDRRARAPSRPPATGRLSTTSAAPPTRPPPAPAPPLPAAPVAALAARPRAAAVAHCPLTHA
ncbi:actin-binding protein wsp1-like [Oryza sativa Japonica Group]|uniref:actin-binding protein wsp1-like n=1 Tax=Oryza sativa subsp. japonica TaxID=39947 RepID=UPI0007753729|nr:serine/arginine repetitive matrix protein 1-like [Oryza sativa Japonica Group]